MHEKLISLIRNDLSLNGQNLLKVLAKTLHDTNFTLESPSTYIGYRDCCDKLGLIYPGMDVPWGRLLQQNGLDDLNEWTKRHNLPAITGLIVNVSGDRAWFPSGDYFKSHGRRDPDFDWWKDQIAKALQFNWNQYL